MTARTITGPTRREQDTCEHIIVRYMLPGDGWQADRVLLAAWDQSELKAQRRLRGVAGGRENRRDQTMDADHVKEVPRDGLRHAQPRRNGKATREGTAHIATKRKR